MVGKYYFDKERSFWENAVGFGASSSFSLKLMNHRLSLAAVFGLAFAIFHPPLPALAQNTVFGHPGRVQDNGTNFTGTGLFQFALVTSSDASQTANATAASPPSGFIATITVTFGGSGYLAAPMVTISGGGGSGATAADWQCQSGSLREFCRRAVGECHDERLQQHSHRRTRAGCQHRRD
jgi:hypothetical protein